MAGARALGRGVGAGREALNRALSYGGELGPEAGVVRAGKPRDVKARTI